VSLNKKGGVNMSFNSVGAPFIKILEVANPVVGSEENWTDTSLVEIILTHTALINAVRLQARTLAEIKDSMDQEGFKLFAEGAQVTAFMVGYFAAKSEQPQYKN
jgi:hypothetical protein